MNTALTILDQLRAHPARLAVCEPGGRRIDYAGLYRRVVALALDLERRGLAPGDRVVLQIPAGIELTAATLAVFAAGGVAVLCEPGLGDEVYRSRVSAAQASWLLVHPIVAALDRLPGARALLRRREVDVPPPPAGIAPARRVIVSRPVIDRLASALPPEPRFVAADRADDDVGMIVFTGGTTSAPKGVLHTHGAAVHFLGSIAGAIEGLTMERLVADTLPQALYALRFGGSAFTTRGRRERRARHVLELIRSGAVDSYFGAPYVWKEMMAIAGPGRARLPGTMRTVLLGSAPVTAAFLRELLEFVDPATQVLSVYGLTESGPVCVARADEKLAWEGGGDFVGAPIPGFCLAIEPGSEGGPIGEVLVEGPALFAGYLGEAPRPVGGALRTGDLGRLAEHEGREALVLAGRSKDMIIRRAVNIYPGLLEPPLRAHRDEAGAVLADCALVGVWNEGRQDEDVVLCAELAPGRSRNARELKQLAARIVGADGAPDHVLFVDAMPVTGRQNKVDKAALRDLARRRLDLEPRREQPSISSDRGPWGSSPGALLPFDYGAFARKYALLFRLERAPARIAWQLALRLGLLAAGQASWALDELVARGWRRETGLNPVFILGHQRSGTTFLHRLLCEDVPRAQALSLQEMMVPAVSFQRALSSLERADRALGGTVKRQLDLFQERLLGPSDHIHRLRLESIEEDEFVLWTIFSSIICANDAPSIAERGELDDLRHFERWSERRQARTLVFYRACLQKKLHRASAAGADGARWIVSKNPAFTHKVPQLCRVFPDARFVYLVRNPLETIPSRLHLLRQIWRQRFPRFEEMSPRHVETILADSVRTYLAAERDLEALRTHRWLRVRYEDLVARPREVVEAIYDELGLPGPGPALAATLQRLEARPAAQGEEHRYTLEQFGLDEARIRAALAPVFARYGF